MKYISDNSYVFNVKDATNATFDEMDKLILSSVEGTSSDIVNEIKTVFPIIGKEISIAGSKQAIQTFNSINNEKYDLILNLKDIVHIHFFEKDKESDGYSAKLEILCNEKPIKFPIIYNSEKKLLDLAYRMNKFAYFLVDNKQAKLTSEIIDKINKTSVGDNAFRFRFIKSENNTYLRSVVSNGRYKVYDNNLVLYIALVMINDLSSDLGIGFKIDRINISDSKMILISTQLKSEKIKNDVVINTSIVVSNSELGDGSIAFNIVFNLSNGKGKQFSVRTNQKDGLIISHGYTPATIRSRLRKLKSLTNQHDDIINLVKNIDWNKNISIEEILKIGSTISKMRSRNDEIKQVKNRISNYINKYVQANELKEESLKLLDVFGKLDEYVQDIDYESQIIMQRKFYDIIINLSKK